MHFDLVTVAALGVGYLSILFGVAWCAERGWLGERVLRHPLVYLLSLGVLAGAWAYYGLVDVAAHSGYNYLSYYFGLSAFFMFGPLLLMPLHRICSQYQLTSLADLLTFRFRSQRAGTLVTMFLLAGLLPLLALQIQAVSDTVHLLTGSELLTSSDSHQHPGLAAAFCLIITVFTILFGARHISSAERHNGLVAAIAFETLVKILALLIVGAVAVFSVFGGVGGLDHWFALHRASAIGHGDGGEARLLLLLAFAAAVGMPHVFHMALAEKPEFDALRMTPWAVPLLLLVLGLPVLPIVWAGQATANTSSAAYLPLTLGLQLHSPALTAIAFIGGVSAASSVIVVATLAIASMCLNHLILPFYQPAFSHNIYRWLKRVRRVLIAAIILAGFLFYRAMAGRDLLAELGIVTFVATLQFLPATIAVLHAPRVNRYGFLAGLCGGFTVWGALLLLPVLGIANPPMPASASYGLPWANATLVSLAVNVVLLALVSWLTPTSADERLAANLCSMDNLSRPQRQMLGVTSVREAIDRLAVVLGDGVARREVDRALQLLHLGPDERRPYALRRLREQIEANLSGLLGASVAHEMINRVLPFERPGNTGGGGDDIQLIETRLEAFQSNLTGLAAELDGLRRLYRQTLLQLPIGVCGLGQDHEILMYNDTMSALTGVTGADVVGSVVDSLPPPFDRLLLDFAASPQSHLHNQCVRVDGQPRWLTLHKTRPEAPHYLGDQLILVEDTTDTQLLEKELIHSERLASVGRLAAGIAHEIGNPVTGIACLAQNMRDETHDSELLAMARDILTQTDRISSIVRTLVNFSHGGGNHTDRERENVDINHCATEAIKLLSLDRDATPIHFVNSCASDHRVLGDSQQLIQVLVNLLSNARDASAAGGDVEVTSELRDDGNILVHVTDRGSGIPEALQEQIFEPFFTTKEPGSGTGLGLALVYSIIEDHGGSISVTSPLHGSRGTRMTIRLPAAART